jgi:chromate transporter
LLARTWPVPVFEVADAFYRPGALVFGGGHVVLPLLEDETVGRGWLDRETFLAGYGAAQALPGPLFAFAAFLGAASQTGLPHLAAGLIALAAVFLPGALLDTAALPYWGRLKTRPRANGFVRGANAAVVGVLGAALWDPVITAGILGPRDGAIALAGFAVLQFSRTPSWIVVVAIATLGAVSSVWL